jgi:hypothetical protein
MVRTYLMYINSLALRVMLCWGLDLSLRTGLVLIRRPNYEPLH